LPAEGAIVKLEPIEDARTKITLLRSWIVNDPDGRWRECEPIRTAPYTIEFHRSSVDFEVIDDNGEAIHSFTIPISSEKSQLWVEQNKDQWYITEYIHELIP
jgi:hypothetical protein